MSTQARIYEFIHFLNKVAIDDDMIQNRISYYGPSVVGLTTNDQVQFSIDICPAASLCDTAYDKMSCRDRDLLEINTLKKIANNLKGNMHNMEIL